MKIEMWIDLEFTKNFIVHEFVMEHKAAYRI